LGKQDLRSWIAELEAAGDLMHVKGADRETEIGGITTNLPLLRWLVSHPLVHRPWGTYRSIHNGERVQVKHIMVKPGGILSLQMHHHRAEHWIVVSGTARITRGEEVFLLEENQSTYIPIGVKHRIENPGMIPLHIIEVQSGSYLGEDDIVRFDDRYGRQGTTT